jgi:RimJ/RimL family protein N-acetyltransferase
MHEMPPPLPAAQLALRATRPLKPEPVTLAGEWVRLTPLDVARDAASLYAISNGEPITAPGLEYDAYDADALVWRWMFGGPFATLDEFSASLHAQVGAADGLPFLVSLVETGQPVGLINLMRNNPAWLSIELGGIWYTPPVQRSPVNTEATYLLLRHCFGLGYRRLEWKCNALNERSRRAAARMGFTFEGIQQKHMIVKGRTRDTAWFRILDDEWPDVQRHLERLLYGNC